jgi:undecaprenyl diphosphate synthase
MTKGEIEIDKTKMPKHVAIIMDGNRRWAAKKGLGPVAGHKAAAEKAIEPIVTRALELGIKFITFWAFSTENWQRDKKELEGLMIGTEN